MKSNNKQVSEDALTELYELSDEMDRQDFEQQCTFNLSADDPEPRRKRRVPDHPLVDYLLRLMR